MNLKTLYCIIIMLLGYNSFSQSSVSDNSVDWKLYEDKKIGYSVEYPSNWIAKGAKRGFICGQKSGFINAEWMIWISKPNNKERIDFIFNHDGLYDDYDILEKPIMINGVNAVHSIIIHKEKPDEYIEYVVIKTKSFWYQIENSGVKDENFEVFYKSFKLLK